jgi:outer membrane protein
MKPAFILVLISYLLSTNLKSQTDTLSVSLVEIVALAQSDAPDALLAETRMKNRYWFYQSILADYKPGLNFETTLPDLNRSIGLISLPDGSSTFVQQSQVVNSVGLSLNQRIAKTGGTIFARSNLQRLDLLVPKAPNQTSYFSTPFSIGFQQPVFGYNELKWNKKIEPLRYQEATRTYAEEMDEVGFQASNLFFEVFISQLNLRAARQDKANADTLFNISKGRFEVGRIAETELLQIELSSMNANAAVQQALLDLQSGTERLRNFLGIRKSIFFKLEAPEDIPTFNVKPEEALRSNRGFRMDIFGQLGYAQRGKTFDEVYQNPDDYQRLVVGATVPILDWGRGQARLETAYSNRELERMNVEQDKVNFEQEILLKVKQFDLLRNQVALAKRAYEVSLKREEMTRNRYYIGKIDVLDLGIAVTEKEAARRSYMTALRAFWLAYYDLRRITLFDFERNVSLVRRVEGF